MGGCCEGREIIDNEIDKANSLNPSLIYKVHNPALDISKSTKTKIWSIVTIILFGFAYLILRTGYNALKNINKYFSKCIASLSNQLLFLIFCYIIIILIYTYGNFDSIPLNWEYFISGIAIFILGWILFNFYIIVLSYFVIRKWEKLEKDSISFTELRHEFDVIVNKKYDVNNKNKYIDSSENDIIENFEYLIMKRFFFIPLFPVFKSFSFRKEMNFSIYLKKCLIEKLRLFFKFSWTSWILLLISIMFWNVFICDNSVKNTLIFLMIIPFLGLLFSFLLFLYTKNFYRKIIEPINQDNISDFQDVDYNSNSALQSMGYPKYLLNLIQDEKEMEDLNKNVSFLHINFHQRPPSIYENLMIFGISGFPFLLNLIQSICIIFIAWSVITFSKHFNKIEDKYSKLSYIFLIGGCIIYFILQGFLSTLILKYYTIIDSIEMKRNEKCVKKMINNHLYHSGKISEQIFKNFKRIYFDMKINSKHEIIEDQIFNNINNERENELSLTYRHLQNMIKTCVERYTKKTGENAVIDIENDLMPFLKTLGNNLTNSDIEFMLYLIQNFKNFKGKLTIENLSDIYGAILHFRKLTPLQIVNFVFDNFYKNNPQYFRESHFTYQSIELFINNYHKFFNDEQIEFIKEQCRYLGESFTLDSLMINILSLRQFYAY